MAALMPRNQHRFFKCYCFVAPAFEFRDFELAEREALVKTYPQHHTLITRLTRLS